MGALPQLYAATSTDIHGGELVGPSGMMRGYPKIDISAQKEYDRLLAAHLWDASVEMTGAPYAHCSRARQTKIPLFLLKDELVLPGRSYSYLVSASAESFHLILRKRTR
jgi:hypothetical protein